VFELDFRVEDWQKTHELALEAARRADNVRGEAVTLFSLGNLALNARLSEAPGYLAAALRAFEQAGETHGQVLTLGALAFADRLNGRCYDALMRYQEMLTGCRNAGDRAYEVDALTNIAQIHMDWENYPDAEQLLDQALVICASLDAPRVTAQTKQRAGELYLRLGDLWRAGPCFRWSEPRAMPSAKPTRWLASELSGPGRSSGILPAPTCPPRSAFPGG
jgi:tetratricopeptide (TPR) repeat protein